VAFFFVADFFAQLFFERWEQVKVMFAGWKFFASLC